MAPKSKTWFPNNIRDERANKRTVFNSPPRQQQQQQVIKEEDIKREVKEPDMKVFTVSDSIVIPGVFLPADLNPTTSIMGEVKSRLSKVSSLFSKVQALNNLEEKEENSGGKSDTKSSDKIHDDLRKELQEPLPEIYISQEPFAKNSDEVIQRLQETSDDILEDPFDEDIDFIQVIKTLTQEAVLKDTLAEAATKDTIELNRGELRGFEVMSSINAIEWKDPNCAEEVLDDPHKLQNLFKCMARSCAFTTDTAHEFQVHLQEVHGSQRRRDRHGWLKCSYCVRKLVKPDFLVNHIIRNHGKTEHFQCSNCFHRDVSQWSLLMHQHQAHPGLEVSFLLTSHLEAVSQKSSSLPPWSASSTISLFCQEDKCDVEASNPDDLANHLFLDHKNAKPFTDYQCAHCLLSFKKPSRLLLHSRLVHKKKPLTQMIIRKIEQSMRLGPEDEVTDDDDEVDENTSEEVSKVVPVEEIVEAEGLEGRRLFRCGNAECEFSAETVSDFRDHVAICEWSVDAVYLTCFHCKKHLKHMATLVDHLKTHGLKRYSCSLCSAFKNAVPFCIKNHMRLSHKVNNTKMMPLDCLKTNPDRDYFIVVPKNAMPKGIRMSTVGGKAKDTFSPSEIDDIPRVSMFRHLIRCSVCDFVTKVRLNLVKHLRLHAKVDDARKEIPFITPINPAEAQAIGSTRMTA